MNRGSVFRKYSFSSIIAQGISLVSLLFCARIYAPETFGRFYVVLVICLSIVPMSTLRLDIDLALTTDKNQLRRIIVFATHISFLVIIFVILTVSFIYYTFDPGHIQIDGWIILQIFVLTTVQSLTVILLGVSMNEEKVNPISKSSILQNSLIASFQIGLGALQATANSLYFGYLIGRCFGLVYLFRNLDITLSWFMCRVTELRNFLFEKRYILLSGGSDGLALVIPTLIPLVLGGFSTVGQFGLANTLVLAPINLIVGATISSYLSDANSFYVQSTKQRIDEMVRSIALTQRFLFLAVVLIVAQQAFAAFGFERLFGADWNQGSGLVSIIVLPSVIQMCCLPLILSMWKRNAWNTYALSSCAGILIAIIGIFVGVKFFNLNWVENLILFYVLRSVSLVFLALYELRRPPEICSAL